MPISKKICLLGDFAVGKTSLVRRLVYQRFDEKYLSTIGVHVTRRSMSIATPHGVTELVLMLWDIAGGDGFTHMHSSYLRGAAGVVLVCDVTRPHTLANLPTYIPLIRTVSPAACLMVAANKRDIPEQQLTRDQIEAVSRPLGAPLFLTSAKTGSDVEALFQQLGYMLVGA